jgi:putative transposase
MTKKIIKYEDLEKEVYNLPSTSQAALEEILKGMYAGKSLLGSGGLLTQLVKDLTQRALQGEMDAHLLENTLEEGGNRRNGNAKKTVKTSGGSFELESP